MSRRIVLSIACALAVSLGAFNSPFAQSNLSDDHWWPDVTVLAIAPDGTWGVATDAFMNRAIANAIDDCKRKYKQEIGCGHRSTSVRGGWSLVFRCGTENVLAAEERLADAERAALRQERELRTRYVPTMPACVRTVTVDPHGTTAVPKVEYSGSL